MASKGCNSATAPKSGRFNIDVDGTMREYILAVPNGYNSSEPYRLVFGWHPLGGSAQQVASGGYYGLEREAGGKAIFVSPEGLPFQGNSLGWANSKGGDLAFLRKMLDRFRTELCIDENRIFSTGFSFGGMMSYAVGCAGLMRAIAPQAGNTQVSGCEKGTQPVAMMGFHGDDDTVVAIDGGRKGRDIFIERNQCMDQTMPVEPSWCDGLNANNEPCSCVSYQGCKAGYPVIWCEFNGPHTPAPSSGATIWKFFSQF
jgi:poly(3-hydroxybutyrate) depolymerase